MHLYRLFAQVELSCNLFVRPAGNDKGQNFVLA